MPIRCRRGSPLSSNGCPMCCLASASRTRTTRHGCCARVRSWERSPPSAHRYRGAGVQPLGVMRYIPVAGTAYAERYLRDGFTAEAVASAPSLAWSRDDALQDMLVRKAFRKDIARQTHYVPTAEGFGAAVRAGLGWGMYPGQPGRTSIWTTARSSGSRMCTSMCHFSGSAGSWRGRWSRPSLTPWSQPPLACVGTEISWHPTRSDILRRWLVSWTATSWTTSTSPTRCAWWPAASGAMRAPSL